MSSLPVGRIIERERSRYGSNNLSFPDELGPHGILFIFKNYSFGESRGGFSRPTERTSGDTILLPLPKTLQDSLDVNVQQQSLGIMGEDIAKFAQGTNNQNSLMGAIEGARNAISNSLPSGGDVAGGISELVRSVFSGSVDTTNLDNLSSQIAFLMRRTLDRTGFNGSIDAGLGSVVNPKAALGFEGVNLKRHSLHWDFAVKSRNESDSIRSIVQTIKRNSLPSYIGMGGSDGQILSRALLKYPAMVDVFLLGLDPSYYLYYKTAMVQQVSMDFTAQGGHVIMAGGKPGMVTVSMQLIEADIHTAEDYGGDSSGGATGSTFTGGR